ncbi:hypothetical protein P8C59_004110 [Phyllachora maydis]|uniref:C2H2-type domain-containing protein n=1 Tax=Phyllachora maydis TaxID=1825666 RepID=A0AAD9MAZ8_9PEZI|nr:hypothetical protein P8C59_004110 [Phyllachora maydis]
MVATLRIHPNARTRPLPPTLGAAPLKLTPITGRVSRAKKGVPVHTCDICRPHKTFTRAEHLRRHQLSHQMPGFPCNVPGCGRTFHRADLLLRHQQRHSEPDSVLETRQGGGYVIHPFPQRSRAAQPGSSPSDDASQPPYPSPLPSDALPRWNSMPSAPGDLYSPSPFPPSQAPYLHLDVGMTGYLSHHDQFQGHHPTHCPSSDHTARLGREDNPTLVSIRNPSPPLGTTGPSVGAFIGPVSSLPARIDPACRPKELPMNGLFSEVTMGMSPDGLAAGLGDDMGPIRYGPRDGVTAALAVSLGGGCGLAAARGAMPRYLDVYWDRVHPDYPIVHRPSFQTKEDEVLKCAMAAVATQYMAGPQDRQQGNQLHEFACLETKRTPRWTLQTMQAIILCELFSRFRGRRPVTRPSNRFESVFSRMLYSGPDMPYSGLLLGAEPDRLPSDDQRWRAWLDLEARRRLLTAAFIVDLHTSLFQQQRRVQNFDIHTLPSIPLTGPSAALWEAESAEAWAAQLAADPEAETPTFAPPSGILTPNDMDSRPPFDRAALLCVEMLHLPRNQAGLRHSISPAAVGTDPETDVLELHLPPPQHQQHFQPADDPPQYRCYDNLVAEARIAALFRTPRAAAYLALHHVPLHDLLAVSGDSWVFSQKVLPASSYQRNRRRLKLWADQQHGSATNHPAASGCVGADMMAGMSAARATVYAARAILGFVEREADGSWWSRDMSDYWALYVCALIVWAWNHGARGDRFPHGAGAGAGARAGGGAPHDGEGAAADRDALRWLRLVADVAIERAETEVVQARGWWEADAVVGLVRRRLQRDCVGRWSRLYVEAVRVLERLEESADAGSGRASGGLPNSW